MSRISAQGPGPVVGPTSPGDWPGDWSKSGFGDDPLPGDPRVLQQIVDDFGYLRDMAWSVSQGLDGVMASASSGGFAGATADALREVVSGRLKPFVFNIARAFSLAGEAVAGYRLVLVRAQQAAAGALRKAAGIEVGDPRLAGLKEQVTGEQAAVAEAAAVMERALRDAAEMVSQPIKVPSLWDRIHKKVELSLGIAAGALALLSGFVDGPVGLTLAVAAWTSGTADFVMTAVDYKQHRASREELLLAGLGFLVPGGRGFFGMARLGAGARAVVEGAAHVWEVVRAPAQLAGLTTKAVSGTARGAAGLTAAAGRGLVWLPGAVWRGAPELPSVLARTPAFVGEVWQSASAAMVEDFANMVKRYPQLAAVAQELGFGGKAGMYAGITSLQGALALFTPLRFSEMTTLGFRGAWAELREAADWGKGLAEFRAGYAGYARLGAAGKGVAAAGLHGLGEVSWHGGDAGLHEPEPTSVLAGMHWQKMADRLEKLPEAEFEQLFVGAGEILHQFMALRAPLVRDATAQAGPEVFAPLVAVAYTLKEHGPTAAEVLAEALAEELGGTPLLHGLVGGVLRQKAVPEESSGQASGSQLWVPGTSGHIDQTDAAADGHDFLTRADLRPAPSAPTPRTHELPGPARLTPADPADLELVAYQREATRFERSLGAYLVKHPRAVAEVAKFARIAWERIPREERYRFGASARKLVGAVGQDYEVLEAVALQGNIREQLAFLRVAMKEGLLAEHTGYGREVPSELGDLAQKAWKDRYPVIPEPNIAA